MRLIKMYLFESHGNIRDNPLKLMSEVLTYEEALQFAEGLRVLLVGKSYVRKGLGENSYYVYAEIKSSILSYYNEKMRQFEFGEHFLLEPPEDEEKRERDQDKGERMRKKAIWIIGLVVFVIPLALLFNTAAGGHGTFLKWLSIAGLIIWGLTIIGVCISLTWEYTPDYVPPTPKPKKTNKKSSVDAAKVAGTTLKVVAFPMTMIFGYGAWRHKRKQNKSKEFWRGFRPWY